MTKMPKIEHLFEINYGVNLELNSLSLCDKSNPNSVNFVSRTSKNNGVSAFVERLANIDPIPAGTISVSAGGSVLETYLQPEPYYSGRDLFYLTPKNKMSDMTKLYYCICIKANKYKYNYGRQANKTLKDLFVPDISEIPGWVHDVRMPSYEDIIEPIDKTQLDLSADKWMEFKFNELFYIKKGKRITRLDLVPGSTPFLSAIDRNNGIREFAGIIGIHEANTITINYNGSIGEAFYQDRPFWASDDVNVLYPKFKLNKYIAMFLITIIKQEKYRFNYGRKWHKERMEESTMTLPINHNGEPDYVYMENFIKSLAFSAGI